MALPKQVQAQLAEIEALEKQLAHGEEPKAEETPEEAADTEVEVTDEQEPKEAKPEKAKPADESKPVEVADDFKQKYNTLRGKYDAEVPRLHSQVKELTEKLKAIEANAKKEAEAPKPKEKVSYVTDADREEFGEELIDVQRRVAREVSQEYEERFEKQEAIIKALQDQLSNTGNQIGEMGFSQKLHQLVPDFDQIDNDERWVEWLNEYDPIIRGPRRDLAQQAFDKGDAEAVAHYVKLFRESITPVVEEPRDTRKAELEKQVSPNRTSSTRTQSTGREGKVYSAREVDGVWTKIRNLNARGDFEAATKLEAEITAAYLEGRVR
jgi:uncharacterized coiled-coil protein SlyX